MLNVGERVNTHEGFYGLPVGTTCGSSPDTPWTKGADGLWRNGGEVSSVRSGRALNPSANVRVLSLPYPVVGGTVGSRAQYNAMPVGAQIRNPNQTSDGAVWTKINQADWRQEGGSNMTSTTLRTDNYLVVHHLPGVDSPEFQVGSRITTPEQFTALPVGTRIRGNTGTLWHKAEDGTIRRDRDNTVATNRTYLVRGGTITALPEPEPERLPVGTRLTTQEQFDALPVGTIIVAGTTRYEKVQPVMGLYPNTGWWRLRNGVRTDEQPQFSIGDGTNRIESYPVSTVEAPTHGLNVGDLVQTHEQFALLPIGTIVEGQSGDRYVVDERGWRECDTAGVPFEHASSSRDRTASGLLSLNYNTIVSFPEVWVAGQAVTQDEQARLPIGSVIRRNQTWTKQTDGRWLRQDREEYHGNFTHSMTLISVGGGSIEYESVDQFKHRFREHVVAASVSHLGSPTYATGVLERLGVTDETLPIGTGVRLTNETSRDQVPDGTVIYCGDPKRPDQFGAWRRQDGGWVHLLGESRHVTLPATVETVGGRVVEADWDKPATEPQTEGINVFKAQAWREGNVAKANHGWCGTYENIMARIGIDSSYERYLLTTTDGLRGGDVVTPEQAAGMPLGTVFKYINPHDSNLWAYYIRADYRSPNQAQTRRLIDHGLGGHYATGMTLEWHSNFGAMRIPMPDVADLFQALPVGTVFQQAGTNYVLCENRLARRGTGVVAVGEYRYDQFSHPLTVTSIPS